MAKNNYSAAKKQGRNTWFCPRCKEYYKIELEAGINSEGTEICSNCLSHELNHTIQIGPSIHIDISMSAKQNTEIIKKLNEMLNEQLHTDCNPHYDGDLRAWVFKEN